MKNDIGHYMVGACAIIQHPNQDKILLVKRADNNRYDEWEFPGGRIAQHEEITDGLKREVREETGLTDIYIKKALRFWHIYRGKIKAENEMFGMTFICTTKSENITITPSEHSEYKWVTSNEALTLITDTGIKEDLIAYIDNTELQITSAKDKILL